MPPQGGRKHPQQEYIQINTRNILFICGGAFDGLEQIVESRIGKRRIGFAGGEAQAKDDNGNILQWVEPEDLQRYGLIPEIVGRLPVTVHLDELDEDALVRILQEPKNALVKQYEKMFELEGIGLTFEPDAIRAIARRTLERGTGARGLRSIIESDHARGHVRDPVAPGRSRGGRHRGVHRPRRCPRCSCCTPRSASSRRRPSALRRRIIVAQATFWAATRAAAPPSLSSAFGSGYDWRDDASSRFIGDP